MSKPPINDSHEARSSVKKALRSFVDPQILQIVSEEARRRELSIEELVSQALLGELPRTSILGGGSNRFASLPKGPFGTVLADPPWRFSNRTGKVAPEHRRLSRYDTMSVDEIASLPVVDVVAHQSHLYLWVPNALLAEGLRVMASWGFTYKGNIVWHKIRKDGGSDGRGVGFYFRNVTELVLFGSRGSLRTLAPARRQVNLLATRKREHSRKPDELYPIIESCSPGPRLELFARYPQQGWTAWGHEAAEEIPPRGRPYRGYGAPDGNGRVVAA